ENLQHRAAAPVARLSHPRTISAAMARPSKGLNVLPIYWTSSEPCVLGAFKAESARAFEGVVNLPQPALTLENSIRSIRIIFAVILFAMFLHVLTAEKLIQHEPQDVHRIWPGLLIVGLWDLAVLLYFRFKAVRSAEETLQTQPEDRTALARWRVGYIITFVLSESIVLFGFALRFLGGTPMQSLPFYVIGISIMLLSWPRRP
ncbi:MAG: hypothetical protein ACRD5M_09060, partial [Candidatus Acidiferrales bacterium]